MSYQLGPLNFSLEQLRPIVLRVLLNADSVQEILEKVADEAVKTNLVANPLGSRMAYGSYRLHDGDQMLVQDIIWALIMEGVIYAGMNASNPDLPWIHLSDYGKQVVQCGLPTPHDPDGYLARLRNEVPSIDETIVVYVAESLQTFRINCLLSSTIACGCASEKAILLLVDSVAASISSQSKRDEFILWQADPDTVRADHEDPRAAETDNAEGIERGHRSVASRSLQLHPDPA